MTVKTKIITRHGFDKIKLSETTIVGGTTHSVDGNPGHITYYVNKDNTQGPVSTKLWHKNGQLHRSDGPAYMSFARDGSVLDTMVYHEGKNLQPMIDSGMIIINDDGSIPADTLFTLEMM